jgi:hypothetical protein
MVLNEILKESRPSLRLSEAENNPVVYIDDAEKCGVFENFAHAFVAPSETGVEFVVATNRLSNIAHDEKSMLTRFGGLAVFSILEREARVLESLYELHLKRKKTPGILDDLERDIECLVDAPVNVLNIDMAVKSLSSQPQRSFFYLSKNSSDRPVRLLAPFFPEIRITEVEWSIVESMRTGWMFNL